MLYRHGGEIVAVAYYNVLFAPVDVKISFPVEITEIAGVQPAVGTNGARRHRRAFHKHFAVIGDENFIHGIFFSHAAAPVFERVFKTAAAYAYALAHAIDGNERKPQPRLDFDKLFARTGRAAYKSAPQTFHLRRARMIGHGEV